MALAHRTLTLVAPLEDVGIQARAYQQLGQVYYTIGDYRRGMDVLARNVAILQGALLDEDFVGTNPASLTSLHWLSRCRAEVGAFSEGLAEADAALRVAEATNRPTSLAEACQGVSILHLYKGDVHRAILGLERALDLCRTWDMPLYFPTTASTLGYAYTLCGRLTEGMPLLEHAVEQTVAEGRRVNMALWVTRVGEASLLAGHLEEAHTRAVQALQLARTHQERGHEAWALRLLGEIHAHRHPPEAELAERHYRQALALAEELGMRPLQAHCHCGLGMLYAKIGRRELACTELSAAVELYRSMEMTFWLPQAEAALAQVEGR
jgi:tetratricopeptide (TPR) repeat protein